MATHETWGWALLNLLALPGKLAKGLPAPPSEVAEPTGIASLFPNLPTYLPTYLPYTYKTDQQQRGGEKIGGEKRQKKNKENGEILTPGHKNKNLEKLFFTKHLKKMFGLIKPQKLHLLKKAQFEKGEWSAGTKVRRNWPL